MRRAAKIDENQKKIVNALRSIPGITVQTNHHDILVGQRGRTFWYEIKSPAAVSKRTGTIMESKKKKSQISLEQTWNGHYRIVSSLDEILSDMKINQLSEKWNKPFSKNGNR